MNIKHNFPIMLIVLPTLLVVLLAACSPEKKSAEIVTEAAAQIADFDLPAGYEPDFTIHMLGYSLVSYTPGDNHSHLYLIQSEKELDGEKLAEMLTQSTPGDSDWQTRMTVVDTRTATVRGQDVTLVFSKGVDSQGEIYAQVMAPFKGKGGPALLVLSEPIARWKMENVDAFLASIH